MTNSPYFTSRRGFLATTGTAILFSASNFLSSIAFAKSSPEKILWSGVNILQSCSDRGECKIDEEFPRIRRIFESAKFLPTINTACRGQWGAPIGKSGDLQLTWHRQENNYVIDPDVKYGALVGIAADTVLGAAYAANLDKTLTLYGIQTYLVIFDIERFEILQSFPMRIMSAREDNGNVGINDDLILSEMLNHLGYQPPQKDREKIWLPNLILENLKKLSFENSKPVGLRVTEVTLTDYTKEWLIKQNKNQNLFEGFIGHSLTQSISEIFKIGIQPYSRSKATLEITKSFVKGGRNTSLYQKTLNTAPIELELRARVRGIVSKQKALERYNNKVKEKSLLIMFSIECGRWLRTYAPSDKQRITPISIEPKESIFKQEIKILLTELRTDEFSNDWQMILDLQQRAIDWFVRGVQQEDYQNLASGYVQRGEQRFISMRVNTKDVDGFLEQARALRKVLMSS